MARIAINTTDGFECRRIRSLRLDPHRFWRQRAPNEFRVNLNKFGCVRIGAFRFVYNFRFERTIYFQNRLKTTRCLAYRSMDNLEARCSACTCADKAPNVLMLTWTREADVVCDLTRLRIWTRYGLTKQHKHSKNSFAIWCRFGHANFLNLVASVVQKLWSQSETFQTILLTMNRNRRCGSSCISA